MKKIFNYAMTFAVAATLLSACKPLDKTYSELGPVAPPVVKTVIPPTIASITLGATDYAMLSPAIPASSQHFFSGTADAFANIPSILTKEFATAADKSQVTVTYATSPVVPAYFRSADSTYAHLTYTLTDADYLLLPKNTFKDFSASQVLQWLPYKYTTPVANQQVILTFTYYDGATYVTTQAFIYLNGAWVKTYLVTPAEYASVNRGTANAFVSADNSIPNTLTPYFNTFLKNDLTIAATAKVGDIQYVSYKYSTSERILPMVFNGVNWVTTATTATNLFTLSGSVWTGQLDNTVSYTLAAGDYAKIGGIAAAAPISAGATAITNLIGSSDFTLNSATATSRWTDLQIANSLIYILKANYTAPSVNQKFLVTYKTYSQYPTETSTFIFDGTNFVYQPTPYNDKYTITGDDYATIAADATTGATSSAMSNLNSFGDFSLSGASLWTQPQINAGIANVLKARYTAATSGQSVVVTYAYYSGSNQIGTLTFKFDGTKWATQ